MNEVRYRMFICYLHADIPGCLRVSQVRSVIDQTFIREVGKLPGDIDDQVAAVQKTPGNIRADAPVTTRDYHHFIFFPPCLTSLRRFPSVCY